MQRGKAVSKRGVLYRWRRTGAEDADVRIAVIIGRLQQLQHELKLCTRMESWRNDTRREPIIVDLEAPVPKNHLLRKIEWVMDHK